MHFASIAKTKTSPQSLVDIFWLVIEKSEPTKRCWTASARDIVEDRLLSEDFYSRHRFSQQSKCEVVHLPAAFGEFRRT